MYKEFEGKTEKEAIELAISELNLNRDEIDVEIVDSSKKGIFRKDFDDYTHQHYCIKRII